VNNLANVLRHPRVRGYAAEKPPALLRELVINASAPGGRILDPFCGSGNLGLVARQLGRRVMLFDVDASTAEGRLRVKPFRHDVCGLKSQGLASR
jgi:DNA modification methylase